MVDRRGSKRVVTVRHVSLPFLWRGFKQHKTGLVGVCILTVLIGMAVFAPFLAANSPVEQVAPSMLQPYWLSVFDTDFVHSGEYNQNKELTDAPGTIEVVTESGESPELFGEHYLEDADGKVNLSWVHSNHEITFLNRTPDSPFPDSAEFIYFTQKVNWTPESLPSDVNLTINYMTTKTGDFAQENASLMLEIYIWLIDSSGNWHTVHQFHPSNSEDCQILQIDLNFYDILAGWDGMIEDEEGVQEDPRDELTVACGIAPARTFESVQTDWEGQITVTFDTISLLVFGDYFGLLGTTHRGYDAWSQLVYGLRTTLVIGSLAAVFSVAIGFVLGVVCGYIGGRMDKAILFIANLLTIMPALPFMMILAAFLPSSMFNTVFVIAILSWIGTLTLTRSRAITVKKRAHVESAKASGASDYYILLRHILPNVIPVVPANLVVAIAVAVLSEASLSFLGLTSPHIPSLGTLLADANNFTAFTFVMWWAILFPGIILTLLTLSLLLIGHTLDQILNPSLSDTIWKVSVAKSDEFDPS